MMKRRIVAALTAFTVFISIALGMDFSAVADSLRPHNHEYWNAWEYGDALPEEGHYYLTEDVIIEQDGDYGSPSSAYLKVTKLLDLCLNGHTVTFRLSPKNAQAENENIYAIAVLEGGSLNLYDEGTSGRIVVESVNYYIYPSDNSEAAVPEEEAEEETSTDNLPQSVTYPYLIYHDSEGDLTIYSGTLECSGTNSPVIFSAHQSESAKITIDGGNLTAEGKALHTEGASIIIKSGEINGTVTLNGGSSMMSGGVINGSVAMNSEKLTKLELCGNAQINSAGEYAVGVFSRNAQLFLSGAPALNSASSEISCNLYPNYIPIIAHSMNDEKSHYSGDPIEIYAYGTNNPETGTVVEYLGNKTGLFSLANESYTLIKTGSTLSLITREEYDEIVSSQSEQDANESSSSDAGELGEPTEPQDPDDGKFSGGNGTKNDPYNIATFEDLCELSEEVNSGNSFEGKFFKMTADISAPEQEDKDNPQNNWTPIGTNLIKFGGKFDGGGHKISGLVYKDSSKSYVGLFGYVEKAEISNVVIEKFDLTGNYSIGGICGYSRDSTISKCDVSNSTISGSYSGGICGYSVDSTISKCNASNNISGAGICFSVTRSTIKGCNSLKNNLSGSGGICASATDSSSIENCFNSSSVRGTGTIGGICGYATVNVVIADCENTGEISSSGTFAGGIVGHCTNTSIIRCHNSGKVDGVNDTGGICGCIHGYRIEECSNTGFVEGSAEVGGVCGRILSNPGAITNCFNTGDVTGYTSIGGVCGIINIDPGVNPAGIKNSFNKGNVTSTNEDEAVKVNIGGVCGLVTRPGTLDIQYTYYYKGDGINENIDGLSGKEDSEQTTAPRDKTMFERGELAYRLQELTEDENGHSIWGQNIEVEPHQTEPSIGGAKVYHVKACQDMVFSNYEEHLEHKNGGKDDEGKFLEEKNNDADCVKGASTAYRCVYCRDVITIEYGEAMGHKLGSQIRVDSGFECTPSVWRRICTRCGYVDNQDIPESAKDHKFTEFHTDASGTTETAYCEYGCGRKVMIRKDTQCGESAYPTEMITPVNELADMMFTADNWNTLHGGTDITVLLTVENADATSEEEQLVRDAVGDYSIQKCLDLQLHKVINDNRTRVEEAANPIEIKINIPEDIRDSEPAVVRVHNGQAEMLSDLDDSDETITFESDKFSIYAIVTKIEPGTIYKETQCGDSTYPTEMITSEDKLGEATFTDDDWNTLRGGTDITVLLTVENADATSEDEQLVRDAVGDYSIQKCLNLRLHKVIDDNRTRVEEAANPIEIRINIPEAIRDCKIVRIHNGQAEMLSDLDDSDETITFESDKFSIYAIVTKIEPGTIYKETQCGDSTYPTEMITSEDKLGEATFTDDDWNTLRGGTDITVLLTVENADATSEDEQLVRDAVGDYSIQKCLDLRLYKVINDNRTQVEEAANPIEIRINIPEDIRNSEPAVVRIHNGQAEMLSDLDDSAETITFESDKFSIYAIVTKNEPEPKPGTIYKETQCGDSTYPTEMITSEDSLGYATFTDDDWNTLRGGTDITVLLTVENANATSEEKQLVRDAVSDYLIRKCLDLRLYKVINDERTQVEEAARPIRIRIDIPEVIRDSEIAVVRIHNGQAEMLSDLDDSNETITFTTDKFSVYAIVSKSKPPQSNPIEPNVPDVPKTPIDVDLPKQEEPDIKPDDETEPPDDKEPEEPEEPENPHTGVAGDYGIQLAAGLSAIVLAAVCKRKDGGKNVLK